VSIRADHAIAGLSVGGEGRDVPGRAVARLLRVGRQLHGPLSIQRPEYGNGGMDTQGQKFTDVFGPTDGDYATPHNPMANVTNLKNTRAFVTVATASAALTRPRTTSTRSGRWRVLERERLDTPCFACMLGGRMARRCSCSQPDWIVLHPTDYQDIRLLTDTAGQFFRRRPVPGADGGPGNMSASGQVTGAQDSLWNKPVYVTSAIGGAGTALVGSTEPVQVWKRGGLRVEATNSHASNFVLNLRVIRAERADGALRRRAVR